MADDAPRIPAAARWLVDPPLASLRLEGDWRAAHPSDWPAAPAMPASITRVEVQAAALTGWDSRLAARLWHLNAELARRAPATPLDMDGLPAGLREVLALASTSAGAPPAPPPPGRLARLGLLMSRGQARAQVTLGFLGETLIALGRLLRGRTAMRGQDLLHQLWATGPASLPIVSLVSALVGLIIAYLGAAQLQRFGAQIYMADLVTIGEVREVAALMTAVILAGRVGAAFAAQLGSMQANEEVDALRTLGLDPVEHLVLPRTIALTLMAPLLTVYAALVAMIAGMFVAVGIFRVEPLEYLVRSFNSLTLAHVSIGLLKATVYGLLVALAGCRQGLNAGRSAQAVGDATTAAVVQAIVWIVVAASALTISFQRLGVVMDAPLVSVEDLTLAWGERVIQRGLHFEVHPGEVLVLMGGSGCGKSTLLRHLIGLQTPAQGRIRYGAIDLAEADEAQRDLLRERFGVMFQAGALWSSMSVGENVMLPLQELTELPQAEVEALARFKLALVGLEGAFEASPADLSGGMKKRAAIARAMALDPPLLYLDEPSAGLDPITSARLDELILHLRDHLGTTIVMVTHELDSIFAVADRALFLDAQEKTMTALDAPRTLLQHGPEPVRHFLQARARP